MKDIPVKTKLGLQVDGDGSLQQKTIKKKKQVWKTPDTNKAFELFMEMWLRFNHLQCSHPVRAVHVEPEAQVTEADAGRKWTLGRHLGNVALPLSG